VRPSVAHQNNIPEPLIGNSRAQEVCEPILLVFSRFCANSRGDADNFAKQSQFQPVHAATGQQLRFQRLFSAYQDDANTDHKQREQALPKFGMLLRFHLV